jgi:ankyrin repeat protein
MSSGLIPNGSELPSLINAIQIGRIPRIRRLISNGINIHDRDQNQNTPLHIAADQENFEIVQILVENGADVNSQNIYGATPYYLTHDDEIRSYLIDNGANPNIQPHTSMYINTVVENSMPLRNTKLNYRVVTATESAIMTNIHQNQNMVNFHNEYKYGRYYTRNNYNRFVKVNNKKLNPFTRRPIEPINIQYYKANLRKRRGITHRKRPTTRQTRKGKPHYKQ